MNLRSAIAGVVLSVVVILVAFFNDSHLSEFEDETLVVSALSSVDSVEHNCDISYGRNTDRVWAPLRLWGEEDKSIFAPNPDDVINYSDTWYSDSLQPYDDNSIKTVVFICDLFWQPDELSFRIGIRYPLKTGIYADQINTATRNHVAVLLLEYFAEQIAVNASYEEFSFDEYLEKLSENNAPGVLLGTQKRAAQNKAKEYAKRSRSGTYLINSAVTFANENIYSIIYHTEMNPVDDPEYVWHGLTTSNYVLDGNEGRPFRLDEVINSSDDAYDALVLNSIDDYKGVDDDPLSSSMYETKIIEEMRETPFSLDTEYLSIGCEQYCDTGIMRGRAYWGGFYKIPWNEMEEYLIPEGPLRFIQGLAHS